MASKLIDSCPELLPDLNRRDQFANLVLYRRVDVAGVLDPDGKAKGFFLLPVVVDKRATNWHRNIEVVERNEKRPVLKWHFAITNNPFLVNHGRCRFFATRNLPVAETVGHCVVNHLLDRLRRHHFGTPQDNGPVGSIFLDAHGETKNIDPFFRKYLVFCRAFQVPGEPEETPFLFAKVNGPAVVVEQKWLHLDRRGDRPKSAKQSENRFFHGCLLKKIVMSKSGIYRTKLFSIIHEMRILSSRHPT